MVPPPEYQPKSQFSPVQTCLAVSGVAGCGCLISVVMVTFSTGAGIWNFLGDAMKSTGSYQSHQMAEDRLSNDQQVQEILGAPVKIGWFSKSKENSTDNKSHVCMRVPVTGEVKSGTAYLETQNVDNSWQWHQLILSINGEPEPIVLEAADGPPLCPDFDKPDDPEEVDSANPLPET